MVAILFCLAAASAAWCADLQSSTSFLWSALAGAYLGMLRCLKILLTCIWMVWLCTYSLTKEELTENLRDLLQDLTSGEVPFVRKTGELQVA